MLLGALLATPSAPSNAQGAAYVFELSGAIWTQTERLTNVPPTTSPDAGYRVWGAPTSGAPPTSYTLIGRVTAGGPVLATVPLGATPAFAVSGVPSGTYYVRVQAQNAGGMGAPSNEVAVTVAGLSPPGVPTLNTPTVSGTTVTLSWSPGNGGAPAGYTLTASFTPSGAPIATVPLSGTSASFSAVPSGTYYLRLTASNAAGPSPPSAQVTLTVP